MTPKQSTPPEPTPKSLLFLKDVLHSCSRITEYASGVTMDTFFADKDRFDAVRRHLVIIGEGACHLPRSLRDFYPGIEWGTVTLLKNVGEYPPHVTRDTVWYAVTVTVPGVLAALCEDETPPEPLAA